MFWVALHALGLVNSKVRKGIEGRRGLMERVREQVAGLPEGKRVWFHASSMGEFEQAKPIIAALKKRRSDVVIVATFFSPSGYENSRQYQLADLISYIPFDSRESARYFIDVIRPDVAVMVRYDVWPNHIWALSGLHIPTMIANATMSSSSLRKLPLLEAFHRHVYDAIDAILTVSPADALAFQSFRVTHPRLEAIGDTRYDQVLMRSAEARKRHIIPEVVLRGKKVILAGSTWAEDEDVLVPAVLEVQRELPDTLLVVVPHEPTLRHLEELESRLGVSGKSIRFSALNEYRGEQVILVDSVGILMTLYASAHVAYVGGSFKQGIHNVLEAAVYGIPVLFGPRHGNSQEPIQLVESGGGFVVNNSTELHRAVHHLLSDETARSSAGQRASRFVQANTGATERFLDHLEPFLSQTR